MSVEAALTGMLGPCDLLAQTLGRTWGKALQQPLPLPATAVQTLVSPGWGVAVSQALQCLAVANREEGTVVVHSLRPGFPRVGAVMNNGSPFEFGGDDPSGYVCFTHQSPYALLVVETQSDSVYVIDVVTCARRPNLVSSDDHFDGSPRAVAASTSLIAVSIGRTVLQSVHLWDAVSRSNHRVVDSSAGRLTRPLGLCFSGCGGHLYVVNADSNTQQGSVAVFSTVNGDFVRYLVEDLRSPTDICQCEDSWLVALESEVLLVPNRDRRDGCPSLVCSSDHESDVCIGGLGYAPDIGTIVRLDKGSVVLPVTSVDPWVSRWQVKGHLDVEDVEIHVDSFPDEGTVTVRLFSVDVTQACPGWVDGLLALNGPWM